VLSSPIVVVVGFAAVLAVLRDLADRRELEDAVALAEPRARADHDVGTDDATASMVTSAPTIAYGRSPRPRDPRTIDDRRGMDASGVTDRRQHDRRLRRKLAVHARAHVEPSVRLHRGLENQPVAGITCRLKRTLSSVRIALGTGSPELAARNVDSCTSASSTSTPGITG
jgi:hypothetical protein